MPTITANVDRVKINECETVNIELPDGMVMEIFSDGMVQVWSPSEMVGEFNIVVVAVALQSLQTKVEAS